MYTFSSLRNEVLRHLDEFGDTGTTKANVDNAINQAHAQRLTESPWPFMLWRKAVTFPLVVGQQTYSLHQDFSRPYYFRNTTTKQNLVEVPIRELSASGADWNVHTTGNQMALWGRSPVQTQPSSASVISIVSTSAADNTAAKAITLYGETANGMDSETITPNGTTTAPGVKSFSHILAVTKAASWTGTLTMSSNAAAVTNLVLFPTELGRSYQQLYTLWVPGAADTIEYRFYRAPRTLADDNDIPDIPPPHAGILVWDALLILAAYNGEMDPMRMSVWQDNQSRMFVAMRQTFMDGQSMDSSVRTVRFIES